MPCHGVCYAQSARLDCSGAVARILKLLRASTCLRQVCEIAMGTWAQCSQGGELVRCLLRL
eukprot:3229188-Amphidinium_carterae.1